MVAGDDGGDFVLHEQVRMEKAAREGGREGGRAGEKEGGGKANREILSFGCIPSPVSPFLLPFFPYPS